MDGEPVITLVNSSNATALHNRQRGGTSFRPSRLTASSSGGAVRIGRVSYDDEAGPSGDEGGQQSVGGVPMAVAHAATNVTGATCTEYLLLSGSAKLAVTFHGGDLRAEGFLGLQRL